VSADARIRYALGLVVLPLAYYGAAKSGYVLDFAGPVAAILWLPVGVAIAFLYLGGWRYWPGVLIGDLLANDYHALPIGSAFGQSCGNMLEVLVATGLMRRLIRDDAPLDSVANLGRMLGAIAAGVAVSATIGALSLRAGDVVDTGGIPTTWRTWWLGDFCGAVVVVPLAVAWHWPPPRSWWKARGAELALMVAAVAALSEFALRGDTPATYAVFPALIWSALRFGPHGATVAIAVAAGFTAWNTSHLLGPFVFDSFTRSVLNTQLYIGIAAISTLCLAVVVSERQQFARMLHASRARLVASSDVERRRIEQELHDAVQQRLIMLAGYLGRAARQAREDPAEAPALFEEADAVLSLAIDELRTIAHGIHPAVLSDLGLARAIRSLARRSTVRSRCSRCRRCASTRPPRRRRTTSSTRRWRTLSDTPARRRSACARSRPRTTWTSRSPTMASGAPASWSGPGCRDSAIAWRPSAARWSSRARPTAARSSPRRSRASSRNDDVSPRGRPAALLPQVGEGTSARRRR
jgi:integral membrane sensor domain MASE1